MSAAIGSVKDKLKNRNVRILIPASLGSSPMVLGHSMLIAIWTNS